MAVENQDQITHFQRRLEETIAWCTSQDWSANPAEGLRTAFFRPLPYRLQDNDDILVDQIPPQRQHLVEQVADARLTLLEERGIARFSSEDPLHGGRLLAFAPDGTLQDGAASLATDGFLDDDNLPPWDTWIWYVTNEPVTNLAWWRGYDSYLLSWVPASLIEAVASGIWVNPEECVRWAADLDTPFLRQLKQAGFMR